MSLIVKVMQTLTLRGGRKVSGMFLRANPVRFRTLSGFVDEIQATEIVARDKKYYVSFPPFPAVVMLPLVPREMPPRVSGNMRLSNICRIIPTDWVCCQ